MCVINITIIIIIIVVVVVLLGCKCTLITKFVLIVFPLFSCKKDIFPLNISSGMQTNICHKKERINEKIPY